MTYTATAKDRRRRLDLSRVLPLFLDLDDYSFGNTWEIVAALDCALAEERRRGAQGHWSYYPARHRAMIEIRNEEAALLRVLTLAETASVEA